MANAEALLLHQAFVETERMLLGISIVCCREVRADLQELGRQRDCGTAGPVMCGSSTDRARSRDAALSRDDDTQLSDLASISTRSFAPVIVVLDPIYFGHIARRGIGVSGRSGLVRPIERSGMFFCVGIGRVGKCLRGERRCLDLVAPP